MLLAKSINDGNIQKLHIVILEGEAITTITIIAIVVRSNSNKDDSRHINFLISR